MIERIWHGWTDLENADEYERLLQEEIFPEIADKFRLKRKYGVFVRSQRWWEQFRELALACMSILSTDPSNDQYREPACYSIYRLISPEVEGEHVSNEGNDQMDSTKLAMGIAFGPLIGSFIGLAIGDIGIGISICMLLGIALGIAWSGLV